MLLRNAWYIAAWADEIGGQPLARRICDEPIVLFRDATGRVAALADRCCHRAAPLSMGSVVEEGIQCGYHGPRLSARQDGWWQSRGACRGGNEDRADPEGRQIHPMAEEFGAAADSREGGQGYHRVLSA
jgi:nitrite reductase/ring-hydroxylating ferredoxin subunit